MAYVWGILSFIFWIIGFVMFLGLINPNWINKRLKENQKPYTRKKALVSWIIFSFLFLIFLGIASPKSTTNAQEPLANAPVGTPKAMDNSKDTSTPTNTTKATIVPKATEDPAIKKAADDKAKADAKAKKDAEDKQKADDAAKAKADAEAQKKKDQQDIVLTFEQKIYDTEKPATLAIKNYQDVFQKLSNGSATINDAYAAASNANKACKNVQYAMGTLHTPPGLPKDVEKSLSSATSDISTSYFTTSEALDQMLKYLDDQKPSYVQKYKDSMDMANGFIISGVKKIFDAKSQIGIDITVTSPST